MFTLDCSQSDHFRAPKFRPLSPPYGIPVPELGGDLKGPLLGKFPDNPAFNCVVPIIPTPCSSCFEPELKELFPNGRLGRARKAHAFLGGI